MIKTFLLAVVTVLVGLGIYLYVHLGVSLPVELTVESRGPLFVVYKKHLGAYHQIAPTIESVESWARTNGLACTKTFGEFLDDPDSMDPDRLRSQVGCLLREPLAAHPPEGMFYETRPIRSYVVGHFAGSPAIGPFKVYPRVRRFMEEKRLQSAGPSMEVYEILSPTEMKTEYWFAVDAPPQDKTR